MRKNLSILIAGTMLLSSSANTLAASSKSGADTNTRNEFGMIVTSFALPEGKLTVNLPEDLAPGDIISGSVVADPTGGTAEERSQNERELGAYSVELRKLESVVPQSTDETKKSSKAAALSTSSTATGFTGLVPVAAKTVDIYVMKSGKPVASKSLKLGGAAAALDVAVGTMLLPMIGQAGRPLCVRGVCDGNFGTSNVTMGGNPTRVLAESPRGMILQSPQGSSSTGPIDLAVGEGGKVARTNFQNVVVRLAAPKTMLRKSERTSVNVSVSGADEYKQPVKLKLSNLTPATVDIEGGNDQEITIAAGAGERSFAVKARESGPFAVRAVVVPVSNSTKAEEGAADRAGRNLSRLGNAMAAMRQAFRGFPIMFTGSAVQTVQSDISRMMAYQQDEFLAKLAASGQQLSEERKAVLLSLFLQYRRDQMVRNLEASLLRDKVLAQRLGDRRRDFLWLIRDILVGASTLALNSSIKTADTATPASGSTSGAFVPGDGSAAGTTTTATTPVTPGALQENIVPVQLSPSDVAAEKAVLASVPAQPVTPDDVAAKFKGLMRDGADEDTAKRVMEALGKSTIQEDSDEVENEIVRFAKISDKVDVTAIASKSPAATGAASASGSKPGANFNPDDFEQIVAVADKMDAENAAEKKQLLELAMEAAGRVSSNPKSSDADRKKAREFALRLTVRFYELKTLLSDDEQKNRNLLKDIGFNIEKCLRITDGKDFYA